MVDRKMCLYMEHATHLKIIRYDFVRDILFYIFRWVGVSVKKETPVNFLNDSLDRRLTLRSADVMVYG